MYRNFLAIVVGLLSTLTIAASPTLSAPLEGEPCVSWWTHEKGRWMRIEVNLRGTTEMMCIVKPLDPNKIPSSVNKYGLNYRELMYKGLEAAGDTSYLSQSTAAFGMIMDDMQENSPAYLEAKRGYIAAQMAILARITSDSNIDLTRNTSYAEYLPLYIFIQLTGWNSGRPLY